MRALTHPDVAEEEEDVLLVVDAHLWLLMVHPAVTAHRFAIVRFPEVCFALRHI